PALGRVRADAGPERRERPAAPYRHLQRTPEAPDVARLDARRGQRVELPQSPGELVHRQAGDLVARRRELARRGQVADDRLQVQAGAADQDGDVTACVDLVE